MKHIGFWSHWILASWMIYDWRLSFGDFNGCPWHIIGLCYCAGIFWFVVIEQKSEWRAERGR